MNDEGVIALLKESVPAVPDVPSRYESVRSLAGRQRSYARMQALGAVASVVLVVGAVAALTRSGTSDERPVSDPVATMTAALHREEWVSFATRSRLATSLGVDDATTSGTRHNGDFVSRGGFLVGVHTPGHEIRWVDGTWYQTIDPATSRLAAPGARWVRTGLKAGDDPLADALERMSHDAADVTYAGRGRERGVDVSRYTARVVSPKGVVVLSFALDAQGRPRRFVAEGPAAAFAVTSEGQFLRLDIELFDYGVARPFAAPPDSETVDELTQQLTVTTRPEAMRCDMSDGIGANDMVACAADVQRTRPAGVTCTSNRGRDRMAVVCTDGTSREYTEPPGLTPSP